MFKDYHYLARCVFELRDLLIGTSINSVFTQEKDKLIFHCPDDMFQARHCEISVNSQLPFILIRNEFHKAKKNTFQFFETNLPAKIHDIRIALDDRIINISTNNGEFFILFRGGSSNVVYFENNNSVLGFKKISSPDSLIEEIIDKEFISSFNDLYFPISLNFSNYSKLKTETPYISKRLFHEVLARINSDYDAIAVYKNCVNEIINTPIAIISDPDHNAVFQPTSFNRNDSIISEEFDTYLGAVAKYLQIRYKDTRISNLRKLLRSVIDKEIVKLSSKLNNLTIRVRTGSKEDEYYRKANLLLSNLYNIKSGLDKIELKDNITGLMTKIILDSKLNVQGNANKYFEKAKDEKKNYYISKILLEQTKIKYETYINFRDKLISSDSVDELLFIKDQLNIKDGKEKAKLDTEKINCHKFILDGKYTVVVGRDSKSNDMLTVKIAKQNDYWFHARGMPGSHVVLRVDNPKEAVPKNILNATASIAAYYSKAKTAKVVPVAYTLRKFVRKNKNMNTGQVIMSKEKVLLVKPEIPKNSEFIEE